jgi:hypothetical protein
MKRYVVASLLLLVGAASCTVPSPLGGGTLATTESPYIASVIGSCGPFGCIENPVSAEDHVTICSLHGGPISVTPLDGLDVDSAKITTKNGTTLLDQRIDAGSSATGGRDLGPGECVSVDLLNYSDRLKARVDF